MKVRLAELATDDGFATGPFGSNLVSNDYADDGVPVIRGSNMGPDGEIVGPYVYVTQQKFEADLSRNIAIADDLVFTQRGTLGQVARVPTDIEGPMVLSQSQMRMRVDPKKADLRFIYAACRSADFLAQIDALAIRTGVPHINLAILKDLEVPARSLSDQICIGEVLGALDDKIAANSRLVSTVDALLRALVAPKLVNAEPLFEVVTFTFGEAFKGDAFTPPGHGRPLIRIRDLKSQKCQVWTSERRPRELVVSSGDVLVGMDAEFVPTRWQGPEGVMNQRVMHASSERFGNAITREILRTPLQRIERSKTGTTVIHLNKADLENELALVPLNEEIYSLRGVADPLYARCVAAERESNVLTRTRDELLPLLMDGQIAVKDAGKTVRELV